MSHVSAGDSSLPSTTDSAAGEAELVRECLAGSTRAAQELVHLHHRRVFNFVHQMTRQRQDAEDITQETFIKAFRALPRFDPMRPLINWLLTIARRTALNHFRSARRWEEMPEEIPSEQASPATSAEEHDQVDDIWETARRLLSQRQFEVLWLRYGENLSVAETARVAGLTQTHVKILVFRARQRLMKKQGQP